jgi:hypothetical protein
MLCDPHQGKPGVALPGCVPDAEPVGRRILGQAGGRTSCHDPCFFGRGCKIFGIRPEGWVAVSRLSDLAQG